MPSCNKQPFLLGKFHIIFKQKVEYSQPADCLSLLLRSLAQGTISGGGGGGGGGGGVSPVLCFVTLRFS